MRETDTISERLERLESLLDGQRETIDDQQETIERQQATIERQQARLEALETHSIAGTGATADPASGSNSRADANATVTASPPTAAPHAGSRERSGLQLTRRQTLHAGGILGLLGLGAVGTAAANPTPTGTVGTSDRPLETLFTPQLSAPGSGLSIETGDGDRALELGVHEEVLDEGFVDLTYLVGSNVVIGYHQNEIDDAFGSVIGGGGASVIDPYTEDRSNRIESNFGTISGGYTNVIESDAEEAAIGGGSRNTVSNVNGTVGGGLRNVASGSTSTVGGGRDNDATEFYTTIGGGASNEATGGGATIPGGFLNVARGRYSFAAGQRANALHAGAFVFADHSNTTIESKRRDEARFQMSVATEGGFVFEDRGEPGTGELDDGEAMLYFDGTDLRYAVNSGGTINSESLTS